MFLVCSFLVEALLLSQGRQCWFSFGYSKPFNRSVVLSTFVLIVIYMVLYFTNSFSIINFALALGFAEFVIAIYRLYYCNRYKLIMLYGRV